MKKGLWMKRNKTVKKIKKMTGSRKNKNFLLLLISNGIISQEHSGFSKRATDELIK
jgi:hypothetical protein